MMQTNQKDVFQQPVKKNFFSMETWCIIGREIAGCPYRGMPGEDGIPGGGFLNPFQQSQQAIQKWPDARPPELLSREACFWCTLNGAGSGKRGRRAVRDSLSGFSDPNNEEVAE
jgi:hypothetical protein